MYELIRTKICMLVDAIDVINAGRNASEAFDTVQANALQCTPSGSAVSVPG